MLPALPSELLRPVVRQVNDTKSLLSLMFSSRALHEEAERALYATFNTHYVAHQDSRTRVMQQTPVSKQIGFLNRVIESDRVGSYVQTMTIDMLCSQFDLLKFLEKALPRMHNVTSFGMLIFIYLSFDGLIQVARSIFFPRLFQS
jgi:hypothetical protein